MGRPGFLRFGSTRLSRRTSVARKASASLTRAPVVQSTLSSRRSRSVGTASITASTSSGARPSGGCHCLLGSDLTERRFWLESDCNGVPRTARARLRPDAPVSLMAHQSYRPSRMPLRAFDVAPTLVGACPFAAHDPPRSVVAACSVPSRRYVSAFCSCVISTARGCCPVRQSRNSR